VFVVVVLVFITSAILWPSKLVLYQLLTTQFSNTSQSRITMAESSSPSFQQKPPLQVHFVGSLPLSSSIEVFQRLLTTFPSRLHRIPDGETGKRYYFVGWQRSVFEKSPWVLNGAGQRISQEPQPNTPIMLSPIEYDDFALSSYADFCNLRNQGIIPPGIRFQVCLPTPVNVVMGHIAPKYQGMVEIVYEKTLLTALRRIQDQIPSEDLAIQWDVAVEFGLIEDIDHPFFTKAWFSHLQQGLRERFERLCASVDQGVEMGFHLCYGDMGHKHFIEPKDTRNLVDIANLISSLVQRDINWIHMPVPKDRTDDAYFAPLQGLESRKETKIFLGLAHPWDLIGTQKRIEIASKVLDNFGIASECGFGRTSKDEFEAVMEVLAAASEGSVVEAISSEYHSV
jgi:hypothetical protein